MTRGDWSGDSRHRLHEKSRTTFSTVSILIDIVSTCHFNIEVTFILIDILFLFMYIYISVLVNGLVRSHAGFGACITGFHDSAGIATPFAW